MRKYQWMFVGAFAFGILIIIAGGSVFLSESGMLNGETLERLQSTAIRNSHFFMYLLVRRLTVAGVLLLLSNTQYGRFSVRCFLVWQGAVFGMFFAASFLRYQMKGLLFALGSLFPHQFILLLSYVLLLYWCLNVQYIRRRKPWLLLWIMAGFGLGCFLESYVNPILLSDIIKIF